MEKLSILLFFITSKMREENDVLENLFSNVCFKLAFLLSLTEFIMLSKKVHSFLVKFSSELSIIWFIYYSETIDNLAEYIGPYDIIFNVEIYINH